MVSQIPDRETTLAPPSLFSQKSLHHRTNQNVTMKLSAKSMLLLLAALATSARAQTPPFSEICMEMTGTSEVFPITCDESNKSSIFKISTDWYDVRASIRCRGTAAALACIGPNPMMEGSMGIVLASNDGRVDMDAEEADSVCGSMFMLGGGAEVYRSTCKGDGFKIEQTFRITTHDDM